MAHLDYQFPTGIAYGSVAMIGYAVDVISFPGGGETRNSPRAFGLGAWDVAKGCATDAHRIELITAFRVAHGKLHTFRFWDPSDHTASSSEGVATLVSTGVYQIYKRYQNAGGAEDRIIRLPQASTVSVYKNAVLQTAGVGAGNYALNALTGGITFVASSTKSIAAITQANPGKITTSASHGFLTGQTVLLSGIVGMTQLNGQTVTVTNVDADEFTIGVNTTGYTAYSSGGTAALYPQAGDAITWAGEFDVKARFDTNLLKMVNENLKFFIAQSIPVVEVTA